MSDLHLEFHDDGGKRFLDSLDPSGVDVLVLAGDVNLYDSLGATIDSLCSLYPVVLMVAGNHEYYNSSPAAVTELLLEIEQGQENFVWLNRKKIEVGGVRIAGTTLWYPPPSPHTAFYKRQMNDFNAIQFFEPWVYVENKKSVEFLQETKADVVVTHHLPTERCLAEQYKGHPLNHFFVCDLTEMIIRKRPKYWLHGHTHTSVDCKVGRTKVLCNPLGYPRENERHFNKKLVIEVSGPKA